MTFSNNTFKVDDAHNHAMERADGTQVDTYHIPAGEAVELDASDYTFPAPSPAVQPNCIQVLIGRRIYSTPWKDGQTRYLLSKATLSPLTVGPPFDDFTAGTTCVIGIGHMTVDEASKTLPFQVLWAGMLAVE